MYKGLTDRPRCIGRYSHTTRLNKNHLEPCLPRILSNIHTMQHYISHFDGIDGLKKEDVPIPSPGPGQVLVQIRAISLNYRDMEGRHHPPKFHGPPYAPSN